MNAIIAPHPTDVSIRRALSPLERWYWIADRISPLNGVVRVRARGALSTASLRAALDALQARHPLLRVAITADARGEDPRFAPTAAPIPLREVAAGGAVTLVGLVVWLGAIRRRPAKQA